MTEVNSKLSLLNISKIKLLGITIIFLIIFFLLFNIKQNLLAATSVNKVITTNYNSTNLQVNANNNSNIEHDVANHFKADLSSVACVSCNNFYREYFNLRDLMNQDQNINLLAIEIKQNHIIDQKISSLFEQIISLSDKFYSNQELLNELNINKNEIFKEFYQAKQSWRYKLMSYFTKDLEFSYNGAKAKAKGEIYYFFSNIERWLLYKDYQTIFESIDEFSSKNNFLKEFKEKLIIKIKLKDVFNQIDQLLFKQLDCQKGIES